MATCLSPKKHHLVCELGSVVDSDAEDVRGIPFFDSKAGLLLWNLLPVNGVSLDDGLKSTEFMYESYVATLAPYCHTLHEWVLRQSDVDISEKYTKHLEWTGNTQLFLDCFKMARSGQGVTASLSILLSTAAMERALGDVFLVRSKDPCPAMLKNLLATQELIDIFRENAITLLQILIGPPTSLNLRNILWHGFAAPDEIPMRYSTFLLLVVASLSSLLTEHQITPCHIPHRTPLTLPQLQTEIFTQRFPDFNAADLDQIWELFSTTNFFHKSMLPFCNAALDYFKEDKYGMTNALLLPQLENGLRGLFATANDCPERLLTAESDYFTTFDEMLCPTLSHDEFVNALIPTLGESYMEMLLDLLVHPDGPRLRDHISHGEFDLHTMVRSSAVHVITVCAAFCRMGSDQALAQVPLLSRINTMAVDYTSLFHPICLAKEELLSFIKSLSKWVDLRGPEDEGVASCKAWSGGDSGSVGRRRELMRSLLRMNHGEQFMESEHLMESTLMPFSDLQPLVECISKSSAETLFRSRKELEVTSLLRRITVQCEATGVNVVIMATQRYQQYVAMELRSRQRANYSRLLNSIPRLSSGLRLIILLLFCQLRNLTSLKSSTSKDIQSQIKFLKGVLRYAENVNSLTGPERNKWDECCTLIESLYSLVQSYSVKLKP
ncbi:endoplasmic reticulum membrane-associated RNA degradation protein-like isoform X1 [Asterias rubens]|uniref:endoplasmic reticulum membrane-associated RNA degradation protein-like isoform X1 n=2 Tax=Asterias rubens TaxID=7604 RepID=UPI001454EA62|nr:endoplasmic reticulum membrane-associated RNA degradation protein-like isoform X1 [Asterias rubens]XP_033631083.1 endoplasmic reticulum membrane-associated RNA degradation protein-like isoform X1 [Asterias rubens]XP_033631092.1 endoplasmic reticulum membrane-associated RNA degradation protein-like isoform X1 [Asterias rubens]XP_033631098.1 endoplasmic reticulum membrane-associated RNA degradation protein-like isoform X1 [Asterias rubens]XP_033631106.1 endoplasmic reticulum membrane-associate